LQSKTVIRWPLIALVSMLAAICVSVLSVYLFPDQMQPAMPVEGTVMDDGVAAALGASDLPLPGSVEEAGRIRGRVFRPNGEPAGLCRVVLQAVGESRSLETQTDAGGSFTFDDVPAGTYVIEASREDYGPAMAIGVTPGGSTLRLVLQSGRELTGSVLMNGEPVPRAIIHLGGWGIYPGRTVTADSAGGYRIPGLRPGTYQAIVTAPEAGSGFVTDLVIGNDDSSEAVRHDFELRRAPVFDVQLVDRSDGQPLVGAFLTIAAEALHVVGVHVEANSGTATIGFLPVGQYYVTVNAPGYLPHSQRLFVTGDPVRIALSNGVTIRGRVTDEAGNPVAGARMSAIMQQSDGVPVLAGEQTALAFRRNGNDGQTWWAPPADVTSDGDGRFELSGLPPSTVVVRASHPDYAHTLSDPLSVTSRQDIDDVQLTLRGGFTIRGRVENMAGAALADATVTVRHPDLAPWNDPRRVRTDSTGMFRFDDLESRVVVRVQHPSYEPMEFGIDVGEGRDSIAVRLSSTRTGVYSGRVFRPDGSAAAGATVWVMSDLNDVPICRATVDEDAWFNASRCIAQPERIIVVGDRITPLVADVGESSEPRDWTLPRGGELDVVSQRAPVDVSVQPDFALPASLWTRPQFRMDRWARSRLERLPPGSYTVMCTSEGTVAATVSVQVAEGERAEAACPWLSPLTPLPIYVVDHLGARVADAIIFVDGVDPSIRTATNREGNITVEAAPDTWLQVEAFHESWGQGSANLYVPFEVPSDPPRVVLRTPIGGDDPEAFLSDLRSWGLPAVRDFRSIVLDTPQPDSPAASQGIRRGDRVLWFRQTGTGRASLGVRRSSQVLTMELTRSARP
jgi:hypothetical protein